MAPFPNGRHQPCHQIWDATPLVPFSPPIVSTTTILDTNTHADLFCSACHFGFQSALPLRAEQFPLPTCLQICGVHRDYQACSRPPVVSLGTSTLFLTRFVLLFRVTLVRPSAIAWHYFYLAGSSCRSRPRPGDRQGKTPPSDGAIQACLIRYDYCLYLAATTVLLLSKSLVC